MPASTTSFVLRCTLVVSIFVSSVCCADEAQRKKRFIYNDDGSNMFIYKDVPMQPEDVYDYVDDVANTQVTTFFMCPNYCMPMLYPSKVTEMIGTNLGEDRLKKIYEEGPKPEKRKTTDRGIVNLHRLVEAGHDPVGLAVDRARANGMEVFITYRLNEIHDVQNPDSMLVSKFWRAHPEWRVGTHGDEILPLYKEIIGGRPDHKVHPIVASWFPGALNFAIPEVRALRLAELRECCERFNIDGLDLDFQRFPIYFPQDKGHLYVDTMTEWVRSVRKMTEEVGKERGRPLQLCARILAKPEQNLGIGLDPFTWANEGLVDFLVVSHYLRNDFRLPIEEFRKKVPATMPLYGSIEVEPRKDRYREIAGQLWKDGADGILLFNFFTTRENRGEPPFELLNELGDPGTIQVVPSN